MGSLFFDVRSRWCCGKHFNCSAGPAVAQYALNKATASFVCTASALLENTISVETKKVLYVMQKKMYIKIFVLNI